MFNVEILKGIGWVEEHQRALLAYQISKITHTLSAVATEDGSVGRLNFLDNKTIVPKRFCDADTNGGSQFHAKTLVSRILMSHCYLLMRAS